jgi:hypothetical protein
VADPHITVRDASETPYLARAVLDDATLDSIREANLQFLNLVAARSAAGRAESLGVPFAVGARVRELAPSAREDVAGCPYTLFNMRFEDAAYWRGPGAAVAAAPTVADLAAARTGAFLAWHLAQSNDLGASLALGMGPAAKRAWRGIPVSAIDSLAAAALPFLRARWGAHPTFWPVLVASTGPAARPRAEAVRLLGLQLLAADGHWPPPAPGH